MSHKLLCLFLFLITLYKDLVADHSLAKAEAIVAASPSSMVGGTINAINGNFCFGTSDLHVPGQEALHVSHYYNSKSRYASWLGTGMSLNYSFWIVGKQVADKEKDKHGRYSHMNVEAPGGSVICCLAESRLEGNTYYLDPDIIYGGLTNCGAGELSGKTNLKNTYIKEKVKYNAYADLTAYLSDGTVKEYHRSYSMEALMNARQEQRPNKTLLEYSYHSDYSPKKIVAKRDSTLNWLEFDKKHHEATISTSNGKQVAYKYFDKDNTQYVSEVHSSDAPTQKFDYTKVKDHHCINRISWPQGRFLEVEYDQKGRVTCQKAPVGKNGSKQTIYSFSYHPDDDYTKVLDAYDRKKIYRHSHQKLTAIEEYKSNEKLYRINTFYWGKRKGLRWGEHPKTNEGNLLAEALLDEEKKASVARTFVYDNYGNVLKETIHGNLSGKGKKRFTLLSNGKPKSPVEHYSKQYSYSKDRFHLKLSESETDGPTVKYRYKQDSNILYAKYICDKNKILIREFYSYDKDGVMIQKIIDDGSSSDKSSLTDVTQRLITKIIPVRNKEGYGQGLPNRISEYYLDRKNNKEVLLKRTEFAYNKQSKVIKEKVFDASNSYRYTLHTQYDHKGRVHKKNNELNEWSVYTYDDNSNKVFEKKYGTGFWVDYQYDKANRLISETEYHDNDTPIKTTYSYDLIGNRKSATDRYGNKTHYEYDSFNRVTKIVLPELENGHRYTIQKKWGINDLLQSETNQNGATTTFEYTARKQPLCITYADGTQERCEYNLNGTLKNKWDQSGTRTAYEYDILGRVTKIVLFDSANNTLSTTENCYNAFHLISSTDAMGVITYYNYDQAGRKIEEWKGTETNYSKTTLEYDALGRVSCTKSFYENDSYIANYTEHDFLGRVTLEKQVDMTGACTSWTYYEYDTLGNCTLKRWGVENNKEAEIKTLYNSKGELTKITDEHINHTHILINHTFKNGFNKTSPRKISRDSLENTTEEYFDTLGRLISVLRKNKENKLIAITDFEYNGTGKKVKQIERVIIDGKIDHDYVIAWELDALDRITKQTEQPGAFEEKVTRYSYDQSGRLSTLTKPDGVILSHSYDALGRLLQLSSSDGTIFYTYRYDLYNNPIEISDEVRGFVTERSYDAWDRVLSDGIQDILTQTFTYDALGRLTSLTAPDGSSVDYGYEHTHLKTVKRGPYTHTYDQFDLKGNVLQSTLIGNAGKLTLSYDKKGRTTQIQSPHFTQEIPDDGYDAVGNLKKYRTVDPVGEIDGEAAYDELYQLIEEKGVQDHSYKNDSLSNRLKKDTQEYFIDDINRLITDSVQEYTYDKNGNMIEKKYADKTIYYTYDALDRLVEVADGQRITIYVYDYLHRRIVRTVNREDPEYFLYVGCREVGLYNPNTNTMREYRVLGLGKGAELGASIAIELGQEVYCPIHDYRGNIVCLVDYATGEVEESYRYTGYGECETYNKDKQLVDRSLIGNYWGFSSKRIDPETGFVYFHRRYYFPETGRWITPDPLGFADGPNMYAYVHNNPLTHFDLYGLYEYIDEESEVYGYLFAEKFSAYLAMNFMRDTWSAAKEMFDLVSNPINKSQEYLNAAGDLYEKAISLNGEKISQAKDFAIEKFKENPPSVLANIVSYLLPGLNTGKMGKVITTLKASDVAQDLGKVGKALVDKIAQKALAGSKIGKAIRQKRTPLPKDPSKLLEQGYHDISHADAVKNGHRIFKNPETNDKIRFDLGEQSASGHARNDHYHRYNPNKTGKRDEYLDKYGDPCARGSEASHLYPGD